MNLVGNRRGSPAKLALHLMNLEDNDHVEIHEIRGFIADDLDGAYHEAYGIARGTRCKKFLYSLSLNPPENEDVPVEVFEAAIERIEKRLGFTGQPRTIVFHEKKGRRHAHCVWSRIDAATMTAIDPFEDKLKLNAIGRDIFLEQGWNMPNGYRRKEEADPLNYSHAEAQQAKRGGYNPKELKRFFMESWQRSDSKEAFEQALKEAGFVLARGDKRSHVAVDANGEIFSISRVVGIKIREVRARLGSTEDLPDIEEALHQLDRRHQSDVVPPLNEAVLQLQQELTRLEERRLDLVETQRQARADLKKHQEARQLLETKARSDNLPKGLKAAWFKVSGQYQLFLREMEADTVRCAAQDRAEKQVLIEAHLTERRVLQGKILRIQQQLKEINNETSLASRLLKTDPAQKLIIRPDPEAIGIAAKVRNDPAHILTVLTRKEETFSRMAILRGLSRYIEEPVKLSNAIDQVFQSPELVEIDASSQPFYTTRDILALKAALSDKVTELHDARGIAVHSRYIEAAISEQNAILHNETGEQLSLQQQGAIRHCLGPEKLAAVVGLAGAGKSTLLSAVRSALEQQGFNVKGAALSGKAADGLESTSGIESRTLASWRRSWKKGYGQLTEKDVLVIDEVGMIGTQQLHHFVEVVQRAGAKLILVGDPEQLQPINAGTPFRDIAEQIDAVHLTEIHRQKEEWQKQASLDFAQSRTGKALDAYEANGKVHETPDTSEAILSLVEDYMADMALNGDDVSRLALAHRRKDVFAINQSIRFARQEEGELSDEILIPTDHGRRAFAKGDRILFTHNDPKLGVRNGMIGTVQSVTTNQLKVRLDGNMPRTVTINPKLYTALDHGYATTIHKSQGATIDKAYVLGSVMMDRHLIYVAMTRHRQDVHLYGDRNSLQKMRHSGECEQRDQIRPEQKALYRRRRNRGPTMH